MRLPIGSELKISCSPAEPILRRGGGEAYRCRHAKFERVTEKAREMMVIPGLTRTEQAVFACLAAKLGTVVSRGEVLAVLRGGAPHTVDSHIMAIRRKLEQNGGPAKIETVVGSGFILRPRSGSGS